MTRQASMMAQGQALEAQGLGEIRRLSIQSQVKLRASKHHDATSTKGQQSKTRRNDNQRPMQKGAKCTEIRINDQSLIMAAAGITSGKCR